MTNAFEYGDALLPPQATTPVEGSGADADGAPASGVESNTPYLNLATYASSTLKAVTY
jgi:hypothetical protein